MKRPILIALFATLIWNTVEFAHAQSPGNTPRIGFLTSAPAGFLTFGERGLREGLQELGYVEGKNILIELRHAGRSDHERLLELAKELVQMKMDIIVTDGTDSSVAAQRATTTIPIVGGLGGDPVTAKLVASLARPGGNITGVTQLSAPLSKKRLELLKEIRSNVSPVAVIWCPGTTAGSRFQMRDIESAARELSLDLQSTSVCASNEFESAFSAMKKGGARSLIVFTGHLFASEMGQIVRLAASSQLPAVYTSGSWADAGGLMSYGPNYDELLRRTAYYVHRILKGAKPADLPVETPTKFELVVNLKTAKQIGLTIPESLLTRADRLIPEK